MKTFKIFNRKNILITGGTGSIGSEIVRQLIKNHNPKQIRVYSRDESKHYFLQKEIEEINTKKIDIKFLIGDVRDKERLDKAFRNIDIVFHVAALKHVPFCEYNPFEAIKTNIYGTQNVIDLSIEHNIEKVIAISTDKAVNPNTIMGISKLMMERMIVSSSSYIGPSKTKFCVVRFGNVLNSRGSVVPLWIDQIKNGKDVTVTDKNMKRFFMTIPEAVYLIFLATSNMKGQEIFVLKMPEKNIYKLAQETIKKYAHGKNVKIKITGARDREKIVEHLYTDEENKLIIEKDKLFIIFPSKKQLSNNLDKYETLN